jgi:hypothetical protein
MRLLVRHEAPHGIRGVWLGLHSWVDPPGSVEPCVYAERLANTVVSEAGEEKLAKGEKRQSPSSIAAGAFECFRLHW